MKKSGRKWLEFGKMLYLCNRKCLTSRISKLLMDRETYNENKRFASGLIPSMQRRCQDHDYQGRQMYLITMTTQDRRPLFGAVRGRSDAPADSDEAPQMVASPLGQRVTEEWWACPQHHPEVGVVAFQLMPDHLHGILFVRERLPVHLSKVLNGFKTSCNKAFREVLPSVAAEMQQLSRNADGSNNRYRGLLFTPGYNDRLLLRSGQLEVWLRYLADNPRRLLMKREHPDLFRVLRGLEFAGTSYSALGNRFLLQRPVRLQVQCTRSLTAEEIGQQVQHFLAAASRGAVLVSPSVSPGERAVMRAAFERGYPLIILKENGFTDLSKPSGVLMEACAAGRLLLLAPWAHHNDRRLIQRSQCLQLNELARQICEAGHAEINPAGRPEGSAGAQPVP